jgi:MFS family permease
VRRPAWLTANLIVLCAVSFLQDVSSEMLYPVLPVFATVVLGAPPVVLGLVEGVAGVAVALAYPISGMLGDRFPSRPLIATGYGLAAAGKAVVAAATSWPALLCGRVIDRTGKGIRGAPRDALLARSVPRSMLGRVFGLHRTADTAGAVVGPLLGLAMYEVLDHRIRPLLWCAVVPAVASTCLVALVREAPTTRPRHSGPRLRGLPASYWRAVVVLVAFGLVNLPDVLVLLRLHDIGFSLPATIGAYVLYNAVYSAVSLPAGQLADRIGRRAVVGIGVACFAVALLVLSADIATWTAWLAMAIYGVNAGCIDASGKAWVAETVDEDRAGTAQGVAQGASAAAMLVAGLWAGGAWGSDGSAALAIAGSLAVVLAMVVAVPPLLIVRWSRRTA